MGFLLEHLREIAWVFFWGKIQLAVDVIDARIESLKKEATDLEARHECLLSSVILTVSKINPLLPAFDYLLCIRLPPLFYSFLFFFFFFFIVCLFCLILMTISTKSSMTYAFGL